MQERKGAFVAKGHPLTLLGDAIRVGQKAPGFTVLATDMRGVTHSEIFGGKPVIVSVVPSLDTGVCDAQTRRFNVEAGKLGGSARVATISVDLPPAQKRWCGTAGIEHVTTYSDHRDLSFGTAYGCVIKELRQLSRCIFLVDSQGTVRYVEYVPKIGQQPDYEKALDALKSIR